MHTTMENYLRQGQRQLRRWSLHPGVQTGIKIAALGGSGFLLSAAGIAGGAQPFASGLISAMTGWRSLVMALGAMAGFSVFWGRSGFSSVLCAASACLLALLLGKRKNIEDTPLLIPALLGMSAAGTELVLLFFRPGRVSFPLYFLRLFLAPVSAWFFHRAVSHRIPLTDWVCMGIAVLALAQVSDLPWLGLGYAAAGAMAVWGAFPAAILAGLGLDLSQITQLPMTAVVCIAWFARELPSSLSLFRPVFPGTAWLLVCILWGRWDPAPLPGLVLGGCLGILLPPRRNGFHRSAETGAAQVRLEMASGVLSRVQRLLLEAAEPEIDESVLLALAEDRACTACPSRGQCLERSHLALTHLHDPDSFPCRKADRLRRELQLAQDRLRSLKADRARRQEYRQAVICQYQFLSIYLRQLSDGLPRRGERIRSAYSLSLSVRSKSREAANGDRCLAFPGANCRYYVLLCDGMGTGLGAADAGQSAAELIQSLLKSGFPPEYAFRTANNLLILQGKPASVTLDLAEVRLDSGQVLLFKWGAAPSWLWKETGAEKIGTAMPPPGISVSEAREKVVRLSLCRGDVLILVSDGVQVGEYLGRKDPLPVLPPGELAQWLLEKCTAGGEDDATVAVLRLNRRQPST